MTSDEHTRSKPRRILTIGDAASRLKSLPASSAGSIELITLQESTPGPPHGCHGLIIAEQFPADMDWDHWWNREADTWENFERAAPHLPASSRAVLIAYGDTDDMRLRNELRRCLDTLITQFQATAAREHGIEFSINAVEVPHTHDCVLLHHRLGQHFAAGAATLANGTVTPLEHLNGLSISQAATNSII